MGKVKPLYVCSSCERPAAQWSGRCTACGEWGTVSEHPVGMSGRSSGAARAPSTVLTLARDREEHRIQTGLSGVDRVLGGGLVPGSVVLVAGAPGIGKSTLLLQLASRLTDAGYPCLLASGEEARGQVAARAARLGLDGEGLHFVPGRDLQDVIATALAVGPSVLVVDSIQTIRDASSDSLPGGPGQVRGCADALIGMAKEHRITVLLVGHVTKDGDLAGPRTLEHAVDVVVTFEGDQRSGLRILAGGKNRYGPEGEVAWFEMSGAGLVEREPGSLLREGRSEPGSATAVVLAGRRALAVDVEALVVPTEGPPRRQVAGLDPRRFQIVCAVTDQAAALGLGRTEIFGAAAGGMRLEDPGADLAVAMAVASGRSGHRLRSGTGFVGEVSLTGALRPVPNMDLRVSAAVGAGLRTLLIPPMAGPVTAPRTLQIATVPTVRDALAWATTGAGGDGNGL